MPLGSLRQILPEPHDDGDVFDVGLGVDERLALRVQGNCLGVRGLLPLVKG